MDNEGTDKTNTKIKTNTNTASKVIMTVLAIPITILAIITSSLLGLISLLIFVYLCTYIHELGHVLAGKFVRFENFTVFLGTGKEIIRIKVRDILFVIQSGSGGLTFAAKFGERFLLPRLFIFTMGGICLNGLLSLLTLLIFGINIEPDKLNIPIIFAATNLYLLIIALLPLNQYKNGTKIPYDGLKLLQILFRKEQVISEINLHKEIQDANELFTRKEYDAAMIKFKDLIERTPKNVLLCITYSSCLMKILKFEDARTVLFEAMDFNKDSKLDSIIKNNIAWLYVLELDDDLLNSADKYSKEALFLNPDNPSFLNTRACVLIQSGRIEEGIEILTHMVDLGKPIDKLKNNPMNFIMLAYAFALKGEPVEFGKYFKPVSNFSERLDPEESFLINMLRAEPSNFGNYMNT